MGAPSSRRLARRTTQTSVETERGRVATKRHSCGIGRERGSGEPLDQARARRRRRSPQGASAQRSEFAVNGGTEGPDSGVLSQGSRGVWVSWRCVDRQPRGRSDQANLWSPLSSRSRRQTDARGGLESTEAYGTGQPTQRRGHQEVVR